jgi:hypothetical protein
MSDSSEWNLAHGVQSDPGQFLGVFDDNTDENIIYIKDNSILIENVAMTMRRSVTINEYTVHFQIQNTAQEMSPITIPLSIDPWIRYTPNWGDKYSLSSNKTGIDWGIIDGLSVNSNKQSYKYFDFNATHNDLFCLKTQI